MPKITRFSKRQEYIGVKKDYPLHQFYDDSVKTIYITRFTGRPYNWYDYKDYYVYTPEIWSKLINQLEKDAAKYKMKLIAKDESYGYAYLAPIYVHTKKNPVDSYITKGNTIVPDKPQYKGYYIIATGFMIPQCKRILKKKAIRVYSLSSPEYVRKLDKAAFAFESAKLRDEALKKILTKMKNKYIIRYTKGYWYFSKKRE